HMLVEQVAEREIFRIVVDRHRGPDSLSMEEDRERALDRHAGLDRLPGLVDAADTLGQPRIERIGLDEIVVLGRGHLLDNVGNCDGSRKRSAVVTSKGPMTADWTTAVRSRDRSSR